MPEHNPDPTQEHIAELLQRTFAKKEPPMPPCCFAPDDAELGHKLYAAYNASGERKGLNFQGNPCPLWEELPEDVRVKWRGVADVAPKTLIVRDIIGTVKM